MGRTTKLMALVFFIQFILVAAGIASIPGSGLYTFLTNPGDFGLNSLISFMSSLLALAGLSGVVIGSLFRNDLLTFGGFASIVFSFGMALGELFVYVNGFWGAEAAVFIVSPMVLLYIMSAISFWRGQTS